MKTYAQLKRELNHATDWHIRWTKKYFDALGYFSTSDDVSLLDKYGCHDVSCLVEADGIEIYTPHFDGCKKITREALARLRHAEEKLAEWEKKMSDVQRAINKGQYTELERYVHLTIHVN